MVKLVVEATGRIVRPLVRSGSLKLVWVVAGSGCEKARASKTTQMGIAESFGLDMFRRDFSLNIY